MTAGVVLKRKRQQEPPGSEESVAKKQLLDTTKAFGQDVDEERGESFIRQLCCETEL